MGTCHAVDVCVWVLQVDGLHAPPFSSHDEGDHSLREAGLTPAAWHRWLGRVIEAHLQEDLLAHKLFDARQAGAGMEQASAVWRQAIQAIRDPVGLWDGAPAVAARLRDLADAYAERIDWAFWEEHRIRAAEVAKRERERLTAIEPYLRRIGTMRVFPVVYPAPAYLIFPPAAALVTTSTGNPDSDQAAAMTLAAALILPAQ
jgi:hypothetical protein